MFVQKRLDRSEFIRGRLAYRNHECLHMHIRTSILKAATLEQGQPSFETDSPSTNSTSNEHLPPNFSWPFDQTASLTQGSLGQGHLPSFQLNESPLFTNERDIFHATSPTPNISEHYGVSSAHQALHTQNGTFHRFSNLPFGVSHSYRWHDLGNNAGSFPSSKENLQDIWPTAPEY